jgi:HD-like signal output (HDOD) protein
MDKTRKKKILFVDDEGNLLQGLERMLRGKAELWDMDFASSGPEALMKLESEAFDMVVSDMQMPGMDGVQLLNKVKHLYPHVIRFILSGHADREMIIRSVGPTHQFLAKPCDYEMLTEAISKAFGLQDFLYNGSATSVVDDASTLPTLPELYQKLRQLLCSPDCTMRSIARVIAQDISMTAQILHLVNSAFFGMPRKIDTIEQAVSLIGVEAINSLILTAGIFKEFTEEQMQEFHIKSIYDHSILTGIYASKITMKLLNDRKTADETMLAGMIHDIGKLFFIENKPELWKQVLSSYETDNRPFHELENKILGTTHAEVGAYILGLWGLSSNIVEAVAFHHEPQKAQCSKVDTVAVVHMANALEHQFSPPFKNKMDYDFLDALDITERLPELEELCEFRS